MTPTLVYSLCAMGSLGLALVFWLDVRRTQRAVPRMVLTTGVVRELKTIIVKRVGGSVRGTTSVQVDFSVEGKTYCCRTLYLFRGNWHIGDPGKKFDFPPGQEVGVHYDPRDPRRSALILDAPRQDSAVCAVIVAGIFAVLAFIQNG